MSTKIEWGDATYTKTPPTEPGWYWVKLADDRDIVQIKLFEEGLKVWFSGWEIDEEISTDLIEAWWSTPIPEPKVK